jgi:hypothetical protein
MYPVKNASLGQPFGADPATYVQFGMNGHNGQDFPVGVGTPVYAPEDGVIIMAGTDLHDQYTGNLVTGKSIVLQGTYEHWLLHNSQLLVASQQSVTQGQLIAYSGNTGFVSPMPTPQNPNAGAHCHWGVRPLQPNLNNGYRGFVDPLTIKEEEQDMPNEGDAVNFIRADRGDVTYQPTKAEVDTAMKVTFKDWAYRLSGTNEGDAINFLNAQGLPITSDSKASYQSQPMKHWAYKFAGQSVSDATTKLAQIKEIVGS